MFDRFVTYVLHLHLPAATSHDCRVANRHMSERRSMTAAHRHLTDGKSQMADGRTPNLQERNGKRKGVTGGSEFAIHSCFGYIWLLFQASYCTQFNASSARNPPSFTRRYRTTGFVRKGNIPKCIPPTRLGELVVWLVLYSTWTPYSMRNTRSGFSDFKCTTEQYKHPTFGFEWEEMDAEPFPILML